MTWDNIGVRRTRHRCWCVGPCTGSNWRESGRHRPERGGEWAVLGFRAAGLGLARRGAIQVFWLFWGGCEQDVSWLASCAPVVG